MSTKKKLTLEGVMIMTALATPLIPFGLFLAPLARFEYKYHRAESEGNKLVMEEALQQFQHAYDYLLSPSETTNRYEPLRKIINQKQ